MKNQPAFPVGLTKEGMTLRAYLAGKAMQGLIIKWHVNKKFEITAPENLAKMSCEFADALIEELEK